MELLYQDHLFAKGLFVSEAGPSSHASEAVLSLAKLFNIQIVEHPEWADLPMVRLAQRNIGINVPEPFYRGFPESVRNLSVDERFLDQFLHYAQTYGLGDFAEPGHSIVEEAFQRACFDEKTPVKVFRVVEAAEAERLIDEDVRALLAGTRQLSEGDYALVLQRVKDGFRVETCGSKDTVTKLLADTRDLSFVSFLQLSDVARLVEHLQFSRYGSRDLTKLNFKNQDRKLVQRVIDRLFERGACDVLRCFEKRRFWAGLLHHIHYRPVNDEAAAFVSDIRSKRGHSAYSAFERYMANGEVAQALASLEQSKGAADVLRHLNYLLSRCETDEEARFVLDRLQGTNRIVLVQLLLQLGLGGAGGPRTFAFTKHNMLRTHVETPAEVTHRRSIVHERWRAMASDHIKEMLAEELKGTLGTVFVDEDMRRVALPLKMASSMSGVGLLPTGSRIPFPTDKKLRAFTYWELVDDIDLSAIGLCDDGRQYEFSWREMSFKQLKGIVFSGDQTSGYKGGSEYFDIDLPTFKSRGEGIHYLVFCDNVYSGATFANCFCTAGYMLRDLQDTGKVFEPKTVASSFAVTCPSRFAYLFALDLVKDEFVWLNVSVGSWQNVAGEARLAFLERFLRSTEVISVYDFARMLATEVVDDPSAADVVFSDGDVSLREGAERIGSGDYARILELLSA